jgi:hypothetical protein
VKKKFPPHACPYCGTEHEIEVRDDGPDAYVFRHKKGCWLQWLESLRGSAVSRIGGWNGEDEIKAWNSRSHAPLQVGDCCDFIAVLPCRHFNQDSQTCNQCRLRPEVPVIYPKWRCPKCGQFVGFFGRLFMGWPLIGHKCTILPPEERKYSGQCSHGIPIGADCEKCGRYW